MKIKKISDLAVRPLGGNRWTLSGVFDDSRGSLGVFESPAEALEYARSLGHEALPWDDSMWGSKNSGS